MSEADPTEGAQDHTELLAFLQEEEGRSVDGTLLQEVEAAIKSYNGQPYGDEEDGRSQVVARDVAETTDYMLTAIMDVMVGSGRVVEFEPQNEGDEDRCDDATEAMHFLYRKKSGYRLIHDWAKAGLLEKIAVVKTCVDSKRQRHEGIYHPAELPEHAIEAEETGEVHPLDGSPLYRAVTLENGPVEFRDYFVPLEEFGFSPDATADLDNAPYLNHHPLKTLSELVAMGFDREVVEGLRTHEAEDTTGLGFARDDGRTFAADSRKGMLRKVRYLEEYCFYDLDNDGIAERLKVCRVGDNILDIAVADEQPFEFWCPFPMEGRLVGQSFADKTMDIQRVNTVLERLGLDGLYHNLAPGTFIHEDSCNEHTIDDLLTIRPGRLVRFKGAVPPVPEQRGDLSTVAFNAIEFKIRQREARTGITRLNKGVDEDTLNDTAKGQAQLMSRGQQMERYIIRNFAEAVARLFMKKVGLMRRYGQPFQIRVDGKYRQVDPSQWPEGMEVEVKVGLGSGSKDERIMGRQMLGQVQSLLKQAGSPIVNDENIYNNAVGLARDLGLQPNDLFTEVPKDEQGNPVPPQTPPDPEMMKAQAELQLKQQAHEGDMQLKGADIQAKQQEASLKLELERQKAAEAAQLARDKAQFEREQAIEQMAFEREMKIRDMDHQHALDKYKADKDAEAKRYREGGSLAA